MAFLGLDVGSSSTKAVILDREGLQIGQSLLPTGAHSTQAAERALEQALAEAKMERSQIIRTVATGYGRISVPFADERITEITCHGLGAFHLFPQTRTVIDIGGQDSKVIRLSQAGKVMDFAMNDKCAAGTGRFLEVMAEKLQVPLDQMGPLSLATEAEVTISSVCTVFAESEVISLVAQNHPKESILRGLHRSIVNRVWGLAKTVGISPEVALTGGVAKNQGVIRFIEDKMGHAILVPPHPQWVGALGAALLAMRGRESRNQ